MTLRVQASWAIQTSLGGKVNSTDVPPDQKVEKAEALTCLSYQQWGYLTPAFVLLWNFNSKRFRKQGACQAYNSVWFGQSFNYAMEHACQPWPRLKILATPHCSIEQSREICFSAPFKSHITTVLISLFKLKMYEITRGEWYLMTSSNEALSPPRWQYQSQV